MSRSQKRNKLQATTPEKRRQEIAWYKNQKALSTPAGRRRLGFIATGDHTVGCIGCEPHFTPGYYGLMVHAAGCKRKMKRR